MNEIMKKKIIRIIAGLMIVAGLFFVLEESGFRSAVPEKQKKAEGLSVVATFYPLADFAREVGGDLVAVTSIVPSGVEPHEYEPTPRDILSAYQADVFLLNGAGVDAWAEKIKPELEERGVAMVQMSDSASLLPGAVDERGKISRSDPHFWLDPIAVRKQALAIRDALIARDPVHKEEYIRNAGVFEERLAVLDGEYAAGLAACRLHTIVTSHAAFAYLAKRYGFEMLSTSGISPEEEPSPKHLAELTALVRERGIRYVFFETLVSPKIADTLAREAGTQTLVLNPLEGLTEEEQNAGENYLSVMRGNLKNLRIALECR